MAASRFAQVSDQDISEMKINAVPKSTQNATKYGVKISKGKPAFCLELNYFILKLKSFGVNQQKYRFNTEQLNTVGGANFIDSRQ